MCSKASANRIPKLISIDGLGAFDQISRAAMLLNVAHCGAVLPVVRMFYEAPSSCLWEDSVGTVHTIRQGEGGEQGHALMLLLLVVGQHSALDAVQEELQEREVLLTFHDDIYVVTLDPARVGPSMPCCKSISLGLCKDQDQWRQDAGVEPWWDETSSLRCV